MAILPTQAMAASSPMFEMLQRLCLDTRAEPAAVAKAGADWTVVQTLPAPLLAMYGGPFDQIVSRSHPASGDEEYLLISGTRKELFGQRRTCVLSGPLDADASSAAKAWTGGVRPAFGGGEDLASYLILDTPTGWRAPTSEEAKDPKNLGHLVSLTVATQIDVTILNVSTFAP